MNKWFAVFLFVSVLALGDKLPTYEYVVPTYLNTYIPIWEIGSQEFEHGLVSVFYWLDSQTVIASQSTPQITSTETRKIWTSKTNRELCYLYLTRNYTRVTNGRNTIVNNSDVFAQVKMANYNWSFTTTNGGFPVFSQMIVRTQVKVGADVGDLEPANKWVRVSLLLTERRLARTHQEEEGELVTRPVTLSFPLRNGISLPIRAQHELVFDPQVLAIDILPQPPLATTE